MVRILLPVHQEVIGIVEVHRPLVDILDVVVLEVLDQLSEPSTVGSHYECYCKVTLLRIVHDLLLYFRSRICPRSVDRRQGSIY